MLLDGGRLRGKVLCSNVRACCSEGFWQFLIEVNSIHSSGFCCQGWTHLNFFLFFYFSCLRSAYTSSSSLCFFFLNLYSLELLFTTAATSIILLKSNTLWLQAIRPLIQYSMFTFNQRHHIQYKIQFPLSHLLLEKLI